MPVFGVARQHIGGTGAFAFGKFLGENLLAWIKEGWHSPLPNILEPHGVSVVPDPSNPDRCQLQLLVGDRDVHYVLISRTQLEKLGRDIERELKAKTAISHRP